MKKLIVVLCVALFGSTAWAANFQEGVHYRTVNPVGAAAEPTVTEFFSLYCGNCYNMESRFLPMITPKLKEKGITFEQKHVNFSGDQIGEDMVRGFAVMTQLGMNKELKEHLFNLNGAKDHNHSDEESADTHKKLKNLADIRDQFVAFGYDAAEFDKAAASKEVNFAVKQWQQQQRLFEIYSIPAFVVNNRYLIEMNKLETVSQLVELMDYLSKK
ncbi:thiol:disulfide interchange protein DsbA/DsbL [Ferrimonas lipolytica]|uniref:Thiol:disulfide interchange protein n=1 Tax=Ferrimonas lipolytica TaxID=2724191 RepID=A0A6H1U9G2_9GAMM|nr:thiol:disulfide interchange protein DsbA/DsbL [Ferrimonas lipolytica]QIZ75664.1 thiol:disulfide interchange protein DsbA/DsbL [Ferrimonas lipolytica]